MSEPKVLHEWIDRDGDRLRLTEERLEVRVSSGAWCLGETEWAMDELARLADELSTLRSRNEELERGNGELRLLVGELGVSLKRNVDQVEGCAMHHYNEPEYCEPECVTLAWPLIECARLASKPEAPKAETEREEEFR